MSLVRQYNLLFKKQLNHFAAWSPVIDRYQPGDYGEFKQGVFVPKGNIKEFGVSPKVLPGNDSVKFSLMSSGTRVVRTSAGVSVDVFPEVSVDADLMIGFSSEKGVFIKASQVSVREMQSVELVAQQLYGQAGWKLGWIVVRKVYLADGPVILVSSKKGAQFRLAGKANALRELEAGRASADISVESQQSDSFQQVGGKGPIALDLFKVRLMGGANVSFGNDSDSEPPAEAELDDDWDEADVGDSD